MEKLCQSVSIRHEYGPVANLLITGMPQLFFLLLLFQLELDGPLKALLIIAPIAAIIFYPESLRIGMIMLGCLASIGALMAFFTIALWPVVFLLAFVIIASWTVEFLLALLHDLGELAKWLGDDIRPSQNPGVNKKDKGEDKKYIPSAT